MRSVFKILIVAAVFLVPLLLTSTAEAQRFRDGSFRGGFGRGGFGRPNVVFVQPSPFFAPQRQVFVDPFFGSPFVRQPVVIVRDPFFGPRRFRGGFGRGGFGRGDFRRF